MKHGHKITLGPRVLAPASRHDSPLLALTLDKLDGHGPRHRDGTSRQDHVASPKPPATTRCQPSAGTRKQVLVSSEGRP